MDDIVIYKLGLSFAFLVASVLGYKFLTKYNLPEKTFTKFNISILIFTRTFFFLLIYIVLLISPQSDVTAFYYPQAKNVLNGQIPYSDFESSYSPLFPFLYSLPLLVWDSAKSLVLTAIIIEFISFFIWRKILINVYNHKITNELLFIYVLNPIPFFNVVINGQNQILLALFLGCTILFQLKSKELWAGFVFGLGLLSTKFLLLLFLPIIFLISRGKPKFILTFIITGIIPFLFLNIFDIDFLMPLKTESGLHSSGNIFYLMTAFLTGIYKHDFYLNAILFIVYASAVLTIYFKFIKSNLYNMRQEKILLFIAIVFILFMIFSKKSYTNYLIIAIFPIFSFIAYESLNIKTLLILNIFGILSVMEPSLWFRMMGNTDLSNIGNVTSRYKSVGFIILEICLISFYLHIIKKSYFLLKRNLFLIND